MPADRTFSGSGVPLATDTPCIMVQPSPDTSTGTPRGKGTGQRDWSTSDFSRTYGGKRLNPQSPFTLLTAVFPVYTCSLTLQAFGEFESRGGRLRSCGRTGCSRRNRTLVTTLVGRSYNRLHHARLGGELCLLFTLFIRQPADPVQIPPRRWPRRSRLDE